MTTTFPYGVVSSTLLSRTRRALPHAAQSLLDNGTVVAYAMTCVVDGDENGNGSTHWASGTAVCLPSPDGAVRWVWAYQAMVDSGVAGLTDAVVALTQPHAFSEDEVRQLWCVIRARSQTHAQVEVAVTLMRHTTWLGYDNVHELDGMCEDMARCQAMEGRGASRPCNSCGPTLPSTPASSPP